ncbi:MAG TPA: AraC family transcriptional regulator [Caulobacteraceae bacterium]
MVTDQGQFRIFPRRITGVEATAARSRRVFPRHTHETFGIGLISGGAQASRSGRGMVEAGAGDVITVNPGEVHDGSPLGDAGRSWRMLYLDPALVADSLGDIGEGRALAYEFTQPVLRRPRIAARFTQLFFTLTKGAGGLAVIGWEEQLLALLADAMREGDRPPEPAPPAIAAVRSMLDGDPAAPTTLSDMAQQCGLSRFQVLRGFERATGLTPHAYLIQRRVSLARRLIAEGLGLAEAAIASGFADQSHMTRVFVRRHGITPGAFAAALA